TIRSAGKKDDLNRPRLMWNLVWGKAAPLSFFSGESGGSPVSTHSWGCQSRDRALNSAQKNGGFVDWAGWRAEFPILSRKTYLNSCSLGALSRRAEARVAQFHEDWHNFGASAWY